MAYGVAHSTNVLNAKPMSFIHTSDIENAMFVMKGEIANGETQIYNVVQPSAGNLAEKAYIVANPAWSYDDSRATNQNEENFINKAGLSFRVYDTTPGNKFSFTSYSLDGTAAVGSYVVPTSGSYRGSIVSSEPDSATYGFIGKITEIKDLGYFYTVGQFGTPGSYVDAGGNTVSLGDGLDGRVKMVVFEVIKNG